MGTHPGVVRGACPALCGALLQGSANSRVLEGHLAGDAGLLALSGYLCEGVGGEGMKEAISLSLHNMLL